MKETDTRESKAGQTKTKDLPASGPISGAIDSDIETVDTPNWKDKADNLAFMNEIVEIKIHESGNQNDEQFIQVSNGGISQFIMRGRWTPVKRMFVEVLARAKRDPVSTVEYTDATGARATRIVQIPSLKYPFEMRDKNPDGMVWLQRILYEP